MDDTNKLYTAVMEKGKYHPEEIFLTFCIVLMNRVRPKFDEFTNGLDLTEEDKLEILRGFLEREAKLWESSAEEAGEIAVEVLKKFDDNVLDRLMPDPILN
jgi:hypothetical protein